MDPIKVDFTGSGSGKGPDKKTGVLIPPEKKGLKIAINLILSVVFGLILYYFMLPVFNFKSHNKSLLKLQRCYRTVCLGDKVFKLFDFLLKLRFLHAEFGDDRVVFCHSFFLNNK
jgi:hypothetical protein